MYRDVVLLTPKPGEEFRQPGFRELHGGFDHTAKNLSRLPIEAISSKAWRIGHILLHQALDCPAGFFPFGDTGPERMP